MRPYAVVATVMCFFTVAAANAQFNQSTILMPKAETPALKRDRLELLLKTATAQYADMGSDQTTGIFRLEFAYQHQFFNELKFKADVHLALNAQRSQTIIPSEVFEDGFRLRQAMVQYSPISQITLGLGVVNQHRNFHPIRLLLDDRGFPGAMQQAQFQVADWKWTLFAQQSVPTSQSMDFERQQKEALPLYLSEGVKADWNLKENVTLSAFGLHYAFENMPSVVAYNGSMLGNTAPGATASLAQFAYQFDGIAAGVGGEWRFHPQYSIATEYQILRNLRAPRAFNSGGILVVRGCLCYDTIAFKPAVLQYFNESDTSPAVYSDGRFGRNNREGQGVELRVDFLKWKFSTTARYLDATTINERPDLMRGRSQYVELFLETSYADLL